MFLIFIKSFSIFVIAISKSLSIILLSLPFWVCFLTVFLLVTFPCFFRCLVIFNWMLGIVKFTLLNARFCCLPLKYLELYSGSLFCESLWSFQGSFLRFISSLSLGLVLSLCSRVPFWSSTSMIQVFQQVQQELPTLAGQNSNISQPSVSFGNYSVYSYSLLFCLDTRSFTLFICISVFSNRLKHLLSRTLELSLCNSLFSVIKQV